MSRESIPGRDAITWIYDEWLKTDPRPGAIVVEVGVALGKSISYLADRLLERGRRDVVLYAVDTWAGDARNGEQQALADAAGGDFTLYARMMLENAAAAFELVRPLRVDSARAARLFDASSVDLVVLDADHTEAAVAGELVAWCPKLRRDGWIGGDDHHDHDYPGVGRACRRAFGEGGYEVWTGNDWGWPVWLRRAR
jgi:cephalosporin hydroxylase